MNSKWKKYRIGVLSTWPFRWRAQKRNCGERRCGTSLRSILKSVELLLLLNGSSIHLIAEERVLKVFFCIISENGVCIGGKCVGFRLVRADESLAVVLLIVGAPSGYLQKRINSLFPAFVRRDVCDVRTARNATPSETLASSCSSVSHDKIICSSDLLFHGRNVVRTCARCNFVLFTFFCSLDELAECSSARSAHKIFCTLSPSHRTQSKEYGHREDSEQSNWEYNGGRFGIPWFLRFVRSFVFSVSFHVRVVIRTTAIKSSNGISFSFASIHSLIYGAHLSSPLKIWNEYYVSYRRTHANRVSR